MKPKRAKNKQNVLGRSKTVGLRNWTNNRIDHERHKYKIKEQNKPFDQRKNKSVGSMSNAADFNTVLLYFNIGSLFEN